MAFTELAFYPAVALLYFFGVMRASQQERVELDDRASLNVFCLFVLAQPLCLVIGASTGMATYLLTALISYNFLPWRESASSAEEEKESASRSEKKESASRSEKKESASRSEKKEKKAKKKD